METGRGGRPRNCGIGMAGSSRRPEREDVPLMIEQLVIFGAAGDLASRYLVPGLIQLRHEGKLPDKLRIVGVSQEDMDTDSFRKHLAGKMKPNAGKLPEDAREAVLSRLEYRRADVTDSGQVADAVKDLEGELVAYLALPPSVAAATIRALAAAGRADSCRIVVEKPFGTDLASAQALNALIHEDFPENRVFRVDHFLMKQTVQNVLGVRFANRIFEMLWDRDNVERVEIIWDEEVALEGRYSYYDRAGALRDMIQNHLLQLLCLVGMEPPITMHERDLRDNKVDLLRAVRKLSPEEVARRTIRGRYTAGEVEGRAVPSYVDEKGIDPSRETETFAQVVLSIDNWRWQGVPFLLRTGKAQGRIRREMAIHFRPVPHLAFLGTPPTCNTLRLALDPDRVTLKINLNGEGEPFDLECAELHAELAPQDLPAYSRLLLDILRGDLALSIRGDEAEESWRIVEPILNAWAAGAVPLRDYRAGSDGPEAAKDADGGLALEVAPDAGPDKARS